MNTLAAPGSITFRGQVAVKHGLIRRSGNNHFVDAAMNDLLGVFVSSPTANINSQLWWAHDQSTTPAFYLGTDTTTATTTGATGLTSPEGSAPGTIADSITGSYSSGSSSGIWGVTWTATWNAGTLTNGITIGEMAMYGSTYTNTTFGADVVGTSGYGYGSRMVSRLSAADSDFTSFTVDNTVNLIVTWTIEFGFV